MRSHVVTDLFCGLCEKPIVVDTRVSKTMRDKMKFCSRVCALNWGRIAHHNYVLRPKNDEI